MTEYSADALPARLRSQIIVNPESGCWVWQGARDDNGYGLVRWPRTDGKRPVERVHRVVWSLLHGRIPAGHQVNHVKSRGCVTNACCWPGHLEAVQQGAGRLAVICDHAVEPASAVAGSPGDVAPGRQAIEIHVYLHVLGDGAET